ncbi:MAG: aminotransferase class V-fold PLP-dependent enzyme [Sphingobacteriales bacterium]
MKRRSLLKYMSMAPVAGATVVDDLTSFTGPGVTAAKRDLFKELGIRTFINAAGTYTGMTATLMRPEALAAIRQSAEKFCMLDEVQDKVGIKIAEICRAEAAVVTSGAFAGLTLGMAGILTGMDPAKVRALPKLEGTGIKTEVICQKGHAIGYNQAITNTGAKIVVVETAEDVERAINKNTAAMHYLHINTDNGKIKHEEWIALANKHGIPATIDIAADVPPVENLWRYNEMGFSVVVISGGKALRGPQSAGILMGKKDIIAAARLSMPPRGETIGRGMKVNKEEILGMYVALQEFVSIDHDAEYKMFQERIDRIKAAVESVPGVTTKVSHPKLGNCTPTLDIRWDNTKIKKDANEIREIIRKGNPSIEFVGGKENIGVTAWSLKEGEDKIVAARLKEVLQQASA